MKRCQWVVVLLITNLLIGFVPLCIYAQDTTGEQRDIIVLADVSGSMTEADTGRYLIQAIKVAADLAPENTRLAVVAVNDDVVFQTEFFELDTIAGRLEAKKAPETLVYQGYTNMAVGIEHGVSMLTQSGGNKSKTIILLGDISEGGFTRSSKSNEEECVSLLRETTARALEQDISVEMIFMEVPPDESRVHTALEEMAEQTGGSVVYLENSSEFPKAIERLYWEQFPITAYSYEIPLSESDAGWRLEMPSAYVERARIYVPMTDRDETVTFLYAGAVLQGEKEKTYTFVELERPAQDGLQIRIDTPPEYQNATGTCILILQYALQLDCVVENAVIIPEGEKEEVQHTVVRASLCDLETGKELLASVASQNIQYNISVLSPQGDIVPLQVSSEDITEVSFYPQVFGSYAITADLTVDGILLGQETAVVEVHNIVPAPTRWPTIAIVCITVGVIAVSAAIAFAVWQKRQKKIYRGASELDGEYRFFGKLYICSVLVEGGAREIPPFTFYLNRLQKEKRISLKEVYQSSGIPQSFNGVEDIIFLIGPQRSLVIRNNSKAKIRMTGKEYGHKQKVQLFMGQKLYLIFEENENEIEIYYRDAKEEMGGSSGGKQRSVQFR